MPEGMYLTSLKQTEQVVMLQGAAQSNERVSDFLRHLANNSSYFSKPELVEITTATASLNAREARRVANFSIRVQLQRTQSQPIKPPAGPNPPPDSKGFPNLSLGNLLPGVKP
jgi:type IV pilus assembly protein PilN